MMKDESDGNGGPNANTNDNTDPPTSAKPEVCEEANSSPRQSPARTSKKKTLEALCSIRCHYNSMAHLKSVEEFYSPRARRTEGLDTADKVLQITFSTCTPRLLVRPPLPTELQVPCPHSGGEGGDTSDITSTGPENVSDLESSSETGWSVRDNPIASSNSYKPDADSDEEDFVRKFCNETTTHVNHYKTSTRSSVEHILDMGSEAEIEDHHGRERGSDLSLASEVTSPSRLLFLDEERVIKPYGSGDAESTTRTRKVLSRSSSSNPPQEAFCSLIVEDNCSCSGKENEVKQSAQVGEDIPRSALEMEVLSPPAYLLSVQVSGRIVDVISKSWRSVLSYSDLFLGGSLLIALALPIAVMISKLIISSSREQLICYVPT